MSQVVYFDEIVVNENQHFVVSMKVGGNKIKVIELDGKKTLDQMFDKLGNEISTVDLDLRKIIEKFSTETVNMLTNLRKLQDALNDEHTKLKNLHINFEHDVDIGRLRKERDMLSRHDGDIHNLRSRIEKIEHTYGVG